MDFFRKTNQLFFHLLHKSKETRAYWQKNSLIHIAGFFSATLTIWLGLINDSKDGLSVWQFLCLLSVLSILSFLLFQYYGRSQNKINKKYFSQKKTLSLSSIILWAMVFRLIALYFSPIYEDDFYRYLWDGFQFSHNSNPFGIAPSAFFGDPSIPVSFQAILDRINNPDTPTIYGPILQVSFLLGYWLFPGEVFGLQLIYGLCDMLLIIVLSKFSKKHVLLLYAWCPLIIKETVFTAHPDVLGVLLLMGSFLALKKSCYYTAVILLALSVCAKIFALLFVPLILMRCKPRYWFVFLFCVGFIYAPFIDSSNADFTGLFAFASDWQFNGSIHALLVYGVSAHAAKWICAAMFCFFYISYAAYFFTKKDHLIPRGDWILAIFFLLAPVFNAWYLIWLLAFATLFPSRWAWMASVSVLLSYITGVSIDDGSLALYQQPLWARLLEYGLISTALCVDIYNWHKNSLLDSKNCKLHSSIA